MRMTRFFGKTLREEPAEAETASHRLLLKSGMIRQVASGVYSYLPLAWRSLRKIEAIIREEMDAEGGQEVRMPALQPQELWEETGRKEAFGQSLFTLKDRRERFLVMAPTHEEAITLLVKANVRSYRDLPLLLYQIQTKFRDEARPRGGLIRVREFDMKDAYSFDADDEGLARSYEAMVRAYKNIYRRCGLPAVQVEADSGAIGGKDSHEFLLPTESGEDVMLQCPGCGYAANAERAESVKPPQPQDEEVPLPLGVVHTPGIKTIEELSAYLGVSKSKTLKAVFYSSDGQAVFIVIRGDLEVNEVKLKNLLHCRELRLLATDGEVEGAGLVAGWASPVGLKGVFTVADDSIKQGSNFVVGANRPDYHLRNACYPRDFQPDVMADIALAQAGHACRRCGTPLESRRGVEIGHVFKLGTFFTERLGAAYLDRDGVQRPIIMGCYGIGVGRLLAAVIEQNHDDKGILFPPAIAPYQAHLVALNVDDPQVSAAAEDLYLRLERAGLEVLYDDRQETAGVKFNDADLLGFPLRIVVSPRNLKQGSAEVKLRHEKEAQMVSMDEVVERAKATLQGQKEE
ncbi:MAG: prolyl-tRNA synthetase [Dehalococcoidia bacterium]|nr:prolyl-tRNA synthetase [Dehalococcoidia bacterium]